MTAVWLAVRSRLRAGWRSALALALLVGIGGGAAMAALSGARRTETALDRFLRYTTVNSAVAYITPPTDNQAYAGVPVDEAGRRRLEVTNFAAIRALPDVAWAARAMAVVMATNTQVGRPGWRLTLGYVAVDGPIDATFGRPIIVSGRLPDVDRADEVAVNEELAARAHLRPGSELAVGVYRSDQFREASNGEPVVPAGLRRSLRVVGVLRYPPDVLPSALERQDLAANHAILWLTPAFGAAMGADVANYGVGVMLRLRSEPVDVTQLHQLVAGAVGSDDVLVDDNVLVGFNVTAVASIGRATDVESLALVGFSVLTALATAFLLWQALRRQLVVEGADSSTLAALGMTQRSLVATATLSALGIGIAGAAVAGATAVALSPLTPIGLARRMEVHIGPHVDVPVVLLGMGALVLLMTVAGAATGWRQARATQPRADSHETASDRPSVLTRVLGSATLPATAATGIRLALVRGRGRTSIPVGTLLSGAVVGVAAVTATAVFSASFSGLLDAPRRYGATADAVVGNYSDLPSAAAGAEWLREDPDVAAFAGTTGSGARVGSRPTSLVRRFPGRGSVPLTVIEGRAPVDEGEIALGRTTMRALGKQIGDIVSLTADGIPDRELRIVGLAIVASQGDAEVDPGEGAVIVRPAATPKDFPTSYAVSFRPGVDREAAVERLRPRFFASTIYPTFPPTVIRNVERVAYLPRVLAAVVVLLAVGTLLHGLMTVLHRRRRDLAVMKAVGFSGNEVMGSVAIQATTVAVVGVLVGVPVGLIVGRIGWHLTADGLGVASPPASPALVVLGIAAATLVVLNLLAIWPGWRARMARPAPALRTE